MACGADHRGNADEAAERAGEPLRRQAFVARQDMGGEHREQRRRRVEDGREAAGKMCLSPHDQAKRRDIVDEGEPHQRAPRGARARHREAGERGAEPEDRRGHRYAQGDDRQRRQLFDSHADKEKRSAPEQRQDQQQGPFGGRHRACRGLGHDILLLRPVDLAEDADPVGPNSAQ